MIVEIITGGTGFPLIHRHIAHLPLFQWAFIIITPNTVVSGTSTLFVRCKCQRNTWVKLNNRKLHNPKSYVYV